MDIHRFILLTEFIGVDERCACIRLRAEVPPTNSIFEGHFPGDPLLPGNLQVEIIAQAAGTLMWWRLKLARMGYLIGVDRARFRHPVRPGDTLVANVSLIHEGEAMAVLSGTLTGPSGKVAEAQVRLRLAPFPDSATKRHAHTILRRLKVDRLGELLE